MPKENKLTYGFDTKTIELGDTSKTTSTAFEKIVPDFILIPTE
jgi:hypothetical protein